MTADTLYRLAAQGGAKPATRDNSKLWNDFAFRDDDIVISPTVKSGTTLTQQIVAQLVFDAGPTVYGQAVSPWIDFRLVPRARSGPRPDSSPLP